MAQAGWAEEQAKLAQATCGAAHAAWQARHGAAAEDAREAWVAAASPGGAWPSAEPLLTDYLRDFPAIASPGMMASYSGAEKQISARMATHQQKAERFRLEANAQAAPRLLLAKPGLAQLLAGCCCPLGKEQLARLAMAAKPAGPASHGLFGKLCWEESQAAPVLAARALEHKSCAPSALLVL